MRSSIVVSFATLLSAFPLAAFAQGNGAPAPAPAPAPPKTEAAVHLEPSEPNEPVAIQGQCTLRSHEGIKVADATTAARLVCADLQREGYAQAADVHLSSLGAKVILSVSEPNGANERRLILNGIEEVSVAAPRIAKSFVHHTSEEETLNIENVVGDEARQRQSKSGKGHFALGVTGLAMAGAGTFSPAGGFHMAPMYETSSRIAFGIDGRFATQADTAQIGASVFARYYFTATDISPYAGGGLAWNYYTVDRRANGGTDVSASGLVPYAEAGVELARTSASRFNLGARIEVPTFQLEGSDYGPGLVRTPASRYILPIGVTASVVF